MKKFVLLTVLLQLCLSVLEVNAGGGKSVGGSAEGGAVKEPVGKEVNENDLQFGDLLVFPMDGMNHYAVYVGGGGFLGNIFHMTTSHPPGCKIETVQRSTFRRHNYLDPGVAPPGKSIVPQDRDQMIQTIRDLMKKPVCQTYNVFTSNCEQIATKVRYGEARCKQLGTKAEIRAKFLPNPKIKRREAPAAA